MIPGDGEVIEGVASVDESAITGESAPVIRESGGDRSAVTGGTKVLSDYLVIRITANPGETFLDRMIALVEGAARQKTPNEIALTILLSGLTIIFLLAVVTLQPFAIYSGTSIGIPVLVALLVCLIPTTIGGLLSAIGIAGHGPRDPAERDRHERPVGRGGGRRQHAAARQDRHDHARQPAGGRVRADARRDAGAARRSRAARVAGRRNARRAGASSCWPRRSSGSAVARWPTAAATAGDRGGTADSRVRAVQRDDPHEWRQPRGTVASSAKARATSSRAGCGNSDGTIPPELAAIVERIARDGRHAARRGRDASNGSGAACSA